VWVWAWGTKKEKRGRKKKLPLSSLTCCGRKSTGGAPYTAACCTRGTTCTRWTSSPGLKRREGLAGRGAHAGGRARLDCRPTAPLPHRYTWSRAQPRAASASAESSTATRMRRGGGAPLSGISRIEGRGGVARARGREGCGRRRGVGAGAASAPAHSAPMNRHAIDPEDLPELLEASWCAPGGGCRARRARETANGRARSVPSPRPPGRGRCTHRRCRRAISNAGRDERG